MDIRSFGRLKDGRTAAIYYLRNSGGVSAAFTDYGAALVSLAIPAGQGMTDVVLGHDDAAGYERGSGCMGAVVGRFANRLGEAAFTLNGRRYELTANDGPNTRHGGRDPYTKRLWTVHVPFTEVNSGDVLAAAAPESISDGVSIAARNSIACSRLSFCLDSPSGDQGFPGNLHVEVTYSLTDDNELNIDYYAAADEDTPLNLTNHSYFNLNGHAGGDVLGHMLRINADAFTETDSRLLPTGRLIKVDGTPLDFRTLREIGRDINADYEPLRFAGGYDHNFVIGSGRSYKEAALLFSPQTGIGMSVLTDLPGMQLYTANFLKDEPGKDGAVYGARSGVCLETQFWPDSARRTEFPGGILRKGEEFRSRTTFRFTF